MTRKTNPLIYFLSQKIIKRGIAIFFHKMEIWHRENIPEHGPVVFVANHPSSTMDAFVLVAVTKQRVHYIAHAGLFSNKLKAWLLRSCGVIPVYRHTQKSDKIDRNVEAFRECYDTLERQEAIGIFPEGISDGFRHVRKIKTGAARIVLETEKKIIIHSVSKSFP